MKVLLLVCLCGLVASSHAQSENPLQAMIDPTIHKLFSDVAARIKTLTDNSAFLKNLDINHSLSRLLEMGETQVTDLLLNKVLPWMMRLLQGPGTAVRSFLVEIRDRLTGLDVKNLSSQLPNLVKMTTTTITQAINVLDQMENAGHIDVKSPSPMAATPSSAGAGQNSATAAPAKPWWQIL